MRSLFPGLWRAINCYGINNKGWIVGEGERSLGNNQYRWSGWLLKPVETVVAPDKATIVYGQVSSGTVADLAVKDGASLRVCRFIVPNQSVAPITLRIEATLPFTPMNLWLETVNRATSAGAFTVSLNLMDWTTGLYDPASKATASLTTAWSSLECVAKRDITRYVRPSDRRVWALLRVRPTGPVATNAWCSEHDLAIFHSVPY